MRLPFSLSQIRLALLFHLSVSLGSPCLAQVEEIWSARYGSTVDGLDQPNAVAVDDAGNVYVTGNSHLRYTTVKYDRDGQELWKSTYVPEGSAFGCPGTLAVDASGSVYIASGAGDPYAVVKYSSEGRELWAAQVRSGGITEAAKLALDRSGNAYVVGPPFVIIKYGPDGERLWVAHYRDLRGKDGAAYDVALDDAGNLYVTGSTPAGLALVKYDADGSLLWETSYGVVAGFGRALAVDGAGNAHVTLGWLGQLADE